jgi:threonine/homoserine/homoserine lactone efflux protein
VSPLPAFVAGLGAGFAVAVQIGAVTLLLIDVALAHGPRTAAAAGLGVATVDLAFAALAALAGGLGGTIVSRHHEEIDLIAAATLAAMAISGMAATLRAGPEPEPQTRTTQRPRSAYGRFLAVTAANPLTIVSFAAIAAALSLAGALSAAAFACGVGIGSAAWQLMLALAASRAGRNLGARGRRTMAIVGRLGVLAIAAHLALAG